MITAFAVKPVGFPTYPPPLVRQRIGQESLGGNVPAQVLHTFLQGLKHPRVLNEKPKDVNNLCSKYTDRIVRDLLIAHEPEEVIAGCGLATRLVAAERLGKALRILGQSELPRIADRIEALAGELAGLVNLQAIELEEYRFFYLNRAISHDLHYAVSKAIIRPYERAKEKVTSGKWYQKLYHKYFKRQEALPLNWLRYLQVNEVNDPQLIFSLLKNKEKQAALADARPQWREFSTAARERDLWSSLKVEIAKFQEITVNLDRQIWLFSLGDGLPGQLSSQRLKELAYQVFGEINDIAGFLNHDICHCFMEKLPNLTTGAADENQLIFNLLSLSKLRSHLQHFKWVVAFNRYRLNGKFPNDQVASLGQIVKTAVDAVGYRIAMPVANGAKAKKGFVNYQVDPRLADQPLPSAFELILYNLLKNSGKALEECDGQPREALFNLRAMPDEQYPGVTLITVEDNMTGFDLNRVLRAAATWLKQPNNVRFIGELEIFKKIQAHGENPNIFRTFTTAEILDLVYWAKISGFTKSFSSGLGLAEAAEICQLLGADIMTTNKIEGGAIVTILIGEEAERQAVMARELGYST